MESYSLKWNNHNSTVINALTGLLGSGSLTDVTLAADGQVIAAHSIILSACSPFFEMQLKAAGHSGKHPVIVLHDVKFRELRAIVEFMYSGEVSVAEDDLPRLLAIGDNLQIKGLAEKVCDETSLNHGPVNGFARSCSPQLQSDEHERKRQNVERETDSLVKRARHRLNSSETGQNLILEKKVKQEAAADYSGKNADEGSDTGQSMSLRNDFTKNTLGDDSYDEDSVDGSRGLNNSTPQNFSPAAGCWQSFSVGRSSSSSGGGGGGRVRSAGASGGGGLLLQQQQQHQQRFECVSCGRSYAARGSLLRHVNYECGVEPRFECPLCGRKFQHKHNLNNHYLSCSRFSSGGGGGGVGPSGGGGGGVENGGAATSASVGLSVATDIKNEGNADVAKSASSSSTSSSSASSSSSSSSSSLSLSVSFV